MTHIERTVAQYKARDDDMSEADAFAHARNMLSEKFRDAGEVMDTDPVPSAPEPVVLNDDATGWTVVGPNAWCTGWVITWTATGHAPQSEVVLTGGARHASEPFYMVPVPEPVATTGGPVRVHHGLGGPVTVTAYGPDSTPVGYLFAQELTDDEAAVDLLPGTVRLHVVRDPDDG